MEYLKIITRTRNWVEKMTNHVEYTAPIVKFKTSMIRSSLCDYSDA